MPSLQEMSDKWEIQQKMIDYSTAVDTRNFDGLDTVFTPDAHIDYSTFGGIDGKYPEVKQYLIEAMPAVSRVKICFGSNAVLGIFGASRPSALIRAPTTSVHPPGSLILIGLVAVMVAVALLT